MIPVDVGARSDGPVGDARPVVLACIGAYWPGNDASGVNRSFAAVASALGDTFGFRLIARDRRFGAAEPLTEADTWTDLGFASARYCRIGHPFAIGLRRMLRETPHDVLWLNGFFDREFTLPALLWRRLGLIPAKPVLLSVHGEFAAGALGLKPVRKRFFLALARRFGLLDGLYFHATSEREASDIAARLPSARIVLAPNLGIVSSRPTFMRSASPELRVLFSGRITPVKQLHYAIDVLARVSVPVRFDIFGPAEDATYWQTCQARIGALPDHVRVHWHGEVPNGRIIATLGKSDLFFLPSAGENFGYAIFEALSAGVPVLIGDQTSWRELGLRRAGWDLPLDRPEAFVAAIEAFAALPETERRVLRDGARALAEAWVRQSGAIEQTTAMFDRLVATVGAGTHRRGLQ